MLAPLLVHDVQDGEALDVAHLVVAANCGDRILKLVVAGRDVRVQSLGQLIGREVTRGTEVRAINELLRGKRRAIELLKGIPQLVQVPILHVTVSGGTVDIRIDYVVLHVTDLSLQILTFEDATALSVDDLTLLVHNLVILQNILTDFEVLAFHLSLDALNGVGDNLGVDRNVIRDIQSVHQRFHALTVEANHEIIAHGQVEAGNTRVTLTTGTTTQLVVNAA